MRFDFHNSMHGLPKLLYRRESWTKVNITTLPPPLQFSIPSQKYAIVGLDQSSYYY